MVRKIRVLNRYNVFVGERILDKLPKLINLKKYSGLFLITDKNVEKYWSKKIEEIFPNNYGRIILQSGEHSKKIETVQKIWQKLLLNGCDRKALVIILGGGVTGDLGGFAASTYMRGVDFLQIPTTLLSQVDSSVGGKVGINFLGVKNLVGTFNQPIAVLCDINLLSTLPDREFIEGFGEIIKYGLIADKKYFQFVTSKKPRDFSQDELIRIIEKSCQIKATIISSDERESGPRKLLNFGHTIGHAIESLSQETKTPLLHGEAISIGMVAECKISNLLGLLSDADNKQVKQAMAQAGLPTEMPNLGTDEILEKIKSDKKNIRGETKFTLLESIGKAIINQTVDESTIRKAL